MQLFIHKTVVVYNVFQQQRYLYSSVRLLYLFAWMATSLRKSFSLQRMSEKCNGGGFIWPRVVFSSL